MTTTTPRAMATEDGWLVELMLTSDGPWWRVTKDGYLAGPGSRRTAKEQGLYRTVPEVRDVMGDAFARLTVRA